ncbi:siderophore-interacting protein [Mesorhizobium xinjiangense]|uniref:siderophore-interacting protein n=1 Tax=Mesorhizobium xinjiangense TaxID=2678685 RepID=UPI0012ED19B2|nr:siderophore-interacting protein [Mesorhizobium xinjiangense]
MNITNSDITTSAPGIERVRHELKRRSLTVTEIEKLTPKMLRITLSGEELADFVSLAPDDHIKIAAPSPDGPDGVERREYTPRSFDNAARTLVIDFAVHDAGPATQWALEARPGDTLVVGGPRGSAVVSSDVRRWLLIGDETALPAIGRRIEEAARGTIITSIVAVTNAAEHQTFDTEADLTTLWVHRPLTEAADPTALLNAVKTVELEKGTFAWIAAEAKVTRAIRSYLVEERGHPLTWMKASGYWVMGKADSKENFG